MLIGKKLLGHEGFLEISGACNIANCSRCCWRVILSATTSSQIDRGVTRGIGHCCGGWPGVRVGFLIRAGLLILSVSLMALLQVLVIVMLILIRLIS